MATALLKFDLNDYDDCIAHTRACKALDMALAIFAIQEKVRAFARYEPEKGLEQGDVLDILDKYNINMDTLLI